MELENCHLVYHEYHRLELQIYAKISRQKLIRKRYLCTTHELQRVK